MVITTNVFVPFIIIASCQMYLWSVARRHLGRIASENTSSWRRKVKQERKANKTVLIIIGLFILFWFPSCFYYFLRQTCPRCFPGSFAAVEGIFNAVVKIMTFMSSCTNPLVYCWRAPEFQKVFWKILLKLSGAKMCKAHREAESFCCRLSGRSVDNSMSRTVGGTRYSATEDQGPKSLKLANEAR